MATEGRTSSFLGGVKQEITDAFAATYDEISGEFGEEVPSVIPTALKTLQTKVWRICEAQLKQSYLNGKKSAGNPSTRDGAPRRPPAGHDAPPTESNPFRK
jgi:hypothetical protein